ncbi:hypothetical protein KIM372_17460 [Bombiscardovia nodaiensis]|uniref:Uncharacterized protein n=1 Tax=Bombiscardovia nodaiensis TaxID=2932181 RepID=A0ABM8BAH6_9BIFI|nr:hypothetical protein KIM372_17460 [Bombiscardovia nodaiensis]
MPAKPGERVVSRNAEDAGQSSELGLDLTDPGLSQRVRCGALWTVYVLTSASDAWAFCNF